MTQPDETCKALVVYSPPAAHKKNSNRILSDFYNSRAEYYYFFLLSFVVLSVFARCMHLTSSNVIQLIVDDVKNMHPLNLRCVLLFAKLPLIYSVISFFSGVTVFSRLISCIMSFNFFYTVSFVFFGTIDKFFALDFSVCFAFILAFSVYIVFSAMFFTETSLFYNTVSNCESVVRKRRFAFYCLYFVFYMCITLLLSYATLQLLLNP